MAADVDFGEIIGESVALKRVLEEARIVAPSDSSVLILGETGTGKEVIARAIHRMSPRRNHSFIKVHSATTTRDQPERQIFGFEKKASDESISDKIGVLQLADKGTLFLDELAHFPPDFQPKLAEVLKRGEFERSGSAAIIRVNVRLIAATRHAAEEIPSNRLFSSLYDQFRRSSIQIPSLRERRQDIPLLAHYFLRKFARRMNKNIEIIEPETMDALLNHDWPGNVRQLENFIHHSVVLTNGSTLHAPLHEL